MKQPTLTVTSDFTKEFNDIIKKFKNDSVLVGIPEVTTKRKEDEEQAPINNATLLAISEFGSPINNIPARQPMAIGIRNAQDAIAEQFKLAAKNALTQGLRAVSIFYERAGIIASVSIKKAINTGLKPEPSKATLAARKSAGFRGTKALIVTGQMRNAITYVVQEGRG